MKFNDSGLTSLQILAIAILALGILSIVFGLGVVFGGM